MKGYALAEKHGVPLVIMEPIKGGQLASLPASLTTPFEARRPGASMASWALRWVGTLPHVKVILSGMSSAEQVEDNLRTFANFEPLTGEEVGMLATLRTELNNRLQNGCTGCRYCMPCPAGVDIPLSFRTWNQYHVYEDEGLAKFRWNKLAEDGARPTQCVECGQCEAACPQHLSIRADLKRVTADMRQLAGEAAG